MIEVVRFDSARWATAPICSSEDRATWATCSPDARFRPIRSSFKRVAAASLSSYLPSARRLSEGPLRAIARHGSSRFFSQSPFQIGGNAGIELGSQLLGQRALEPGRKLSCQSGDPFFHARELIDPSTLLVMRTLSWQLVSRPTHPEPGRKFTRRPGDCFFHPGIDRLLDMTENAGIEFGSQSIRQSNFKLRRKFIGHTGGNFFDPGIDRFLDTCGNASIEPVSQFLGQSVFIWRSVPPSGGWRLLQYGN